MDEFFQLFQNNHFNDFESYKPLDELEDLEKQYLKDALINIENVIKLPKYFCKIQECLLTYYSNDNKCLIDLLSVFEIIKSICFNLIATPWREEFKMIRVSCLAKNMRNLPK
jgi:hypothetical protein